MEIRLACDIQKHSVVDGPGIRTVIWTQGCPHHCKFCHNTETHSFKGGKIVSVSDDIKEMIISKNPYNFSLQYKTDTNGNQILDNNGNPIAVGYNDWKPTTNPVEQMDYNTMIRTGLSYINPNAGSNETIIYYKKDKDGKRVVTNDPSEAKFYTINGRGFQEITTADVELALIQAYLANPKFAASLNQDYELAKTTTEAIRQRILKEIKEENKK